MMSYQHIKSSDFSWIILVLILRVSQKSIKMFFVYVAQTHSFAYLADLGTIRL